MVARVSTYRVSVTRDGRFWFVDVHGVGVTQGRNLEEVADMARDLITLTNGDESPELDVHVTLPYGVEQHLVASRALRQTAQEAQSKASEEVRTAARMLHDDGIPLRDIGRALGVSYQRAHQLVSS